MLAIQIIYENMLHEKLTEQTRQSNSRTDQSDYFIHRYNLVIKAHNKAHPESQLNQLDTSRFFESLSKILHKLYIQISLAILMLIAPLLNVFVFGLLWFYFFFIRRQVQIHKQNNKIVNPFNQLFYMPELCENLGKHYTSLSLQIKDLEDFTFNSEFNKEVKQKLSKQNSEQIKIVVYDQYFRDSYQGLYKQQLRVGLWIIISFILLSCCLLIYLAIFKII